MNILNHGELDTPKRFQKELLLLTAKNLALFLDLGSM